MDDLRFLPVSVARALLGRDFYADLPVYAAISVPYFQGALSSEIIRIAESETDAFLRFNYLLNKRLGALGAVASRDQLRDCVQEIDYEVARLRMEVEELAKLQTLRDANLVNLTINVTALPERDVEKGLGEVAGAVASSGLSSVLHTYKKSQRLLQLKKSDLYFAFLLQGGFGKE